MLLNPTHHAFPNPSDGSEGLQVREVIAIEVFKSLYATLPPYGPETDEQIARRKRWATEATLAADALIDALNRPRQ